MEINYFQLHLLIWVLAAAGYNNAQQEEGVSSEIKLAKEQQRFLGTWDYVSVTYEGKPFDTGKDATITITEDSRTINRNGEELESEWSIDSGKKPKHLTQQVSRKGWEPFDMKSLVAKRKTKETGVGCMYA